MLSRAAIACLACLALVAPASAAPGDLDRSFGDEGVFLGPLDTGLKHIDELVVQPDGTYLALGFGQRFGSYGGILARLQPTGQFDPTFGWEGHAPTLQTPAQLIRQPDGRILVGGARQEDEHRFGEFAVDRFLPNGDPDPSFGSGGRIYVRVGSNEGPLPARAQVTSAALDSEGRITVAGSIYGGEGAYVVFVRFLADGSRDTAFGVNGVVLHRRNEYYPDLTAEHLLPLRGGGLLAAGITYRGWGVWRLREDGSLDSSFAGDGRVGFRSDGFPFIRRISVVAGGRIRVLGAVGDTVVERQLLPNGRVDRSFGIRGVARTRLTPPEPHDDLGIADVLRLPDGKLAVTGRVATSDCDGRGPCDLRGFLARITRPGVVDREVGDRGIALPRLGAAQPDIYFDAGRRDNPQLLALLPDEKLILAGSALRPIDEGGTRNVYMLARFLDVVAPRQTRRLPRRLRVRRGRLSLRVGCREAGRVCAGRLLIRHAGVNRRFDVPPTGSTRVRARLTRATRRRLARRGRIRLRVSVRLRDANANSLTRGRRITLVRARTTASAAASAPDRFFGMHADQAFAERGQARAATLAAVRATGAGVIRQQLDWSRVERERGIYDWSEFDSYVEAVALADLDLLPILIGTPAFRSKAPPSAERGLYPPRRASAFGAFAARAVERYGPGGEFWEARPDLPARPIRDWQVWNEPSLAYFWRPRPHASGFGSMLRVVAAAIRGADPGARVIAPALPQSRYGVPLMRYLERMSRAAGRRGYDVAAVNPYARTVGEMMGLLRRTRRWLDRHGRKRVPINVSEFGWASFDQRDEMVQAERVATAVRRLTHERRRLRLSGALHYSWQDADPFPGGADFWGIHTGLFDRGGRAKPAWNAFRREVTRATR